MSDLVLFTDNNAELPAHLAKMGGLGNDNVGAGDVAMPRINLLQQLSPQVNKNKAEFVEGAEPGQLFNTVTNEFVDKLLVINLYYDKGYVVFRKRAFGGKDFQGNHDTEAATIAHLTEQGKDPAQYDISETANHHLLLLDEKGTPISPAITSMSSSKLRVSRQWNTELQLLTQRHGAPRFGSIWEVSSKAESNAKGDTYYNLAVNQVGWANEALTERARVEYEGAAGKTTATAA